MQQHADFSYMDVQQFQEFMQVYTVFFFVIITLC